MFKQLKRLYDWAGTKVHSPHADAWFFILFLIESVFFVPVDPLMVLFCTERKSRAFVYAFLATLASVIGAFIGYMVGWLAWDIIGPFIMKWVIAPITFEKVVAQYKVYQNLLVLVGAFIPFPYKALTLSAGFCGLPLIPFLFFSLLGRGARFFLLALTLRIWGTQIKGIIDQYFNHLVLLFIGFITLVLLFLRR
jgi:membrane protein YqaA with SNARE-associated domain